MYNAQNISWIGDYTVSNGSNPLKVSLPSNDIMAVFQGAGNTNPDRYTRTLGKKKYEINDHLGNVRSVVSDIKLSTLSSTYVLEEFHADILVACNYYAFGMEMPGRTYSSNSYRYGFNGMEKDDEVKGSGNSLDFGARVYDSRLGRWLALDPLQQKHPSFSPYSFVNNMPIWAKDPDGRKIKIIIRDGSDKHLAALRKVTKDKVIMDKNGNITLRKTLRSRFSKNDLGTELVRSLVMEDYTVSIDDNAFETNVDRKKLGTHFIADNVDDASFGYGEDGPIPGDGSSGTIFIGDNDEYATYAHELKHSLNSMYGIRNPEVMTDDEGWPYGHPESRFYKLDFEEATTRQWENRFRAQRNLGGFRDLDWPSWFPVPILPLDEVPTLKKFEIKDSEPIFPDNEKK